ncbi:hypothetical protein [Agromyces sp. Soil535]|uniref:hypothetical protein n=1 Tax=Agromyces sp. Soil535 TaxID=1736390 RepID=UPI0006FB851F|nr:hypothetical protein [Agromyces sp. Soil535]KRE28537.1 hypothetical protein ASG80_21105 [Agromyces sp. Soil535]
MELDSGTIECVVRTAVDATTSRNGVGARVLGAARYALDMDATIWTAAAAVAAALGAIVAVFQFFRSTDSYHRWTRWQAIREKSDNPVVAAFAAREEVAAVGALARSRRSIHVMFTGLNWVLLGWAIACGATAVPFLLLDFGDTTSVARIIGVVALLGFLILYATWFVRVIVQIPAAHRKVREELAPAGSAPHPGIDSATI